MRRRTIEAKELMKKDDTHKIEHEFGPRTTLTHSLGDKLKMVRTLTTDEHEAEIQLKKCNLCDKNATRRRKWAKVNTPYYVCEDCYQNKVRQQINYVKI